MSNPFSSYRAINAERIVRENIHPNHIKEDLTSLSDALKCFHHLEGPDIVEGFLLSRKTVKTIDTKPGLLDLLKHFGFVRSATGEYIYQRAETSGEKGRRRNGVDEVNDLYADVKRALRDSLDGFEDFIRKHSSKKYSHSIDDNQSDDEPLPDPYKVRNSNAATLALLKSFKESLVTEYNSNPSPNFIRLRIARLAFRQKYPDSRQVDDDLVDTGISNKITILKEKYKQANTPHAHHVYMECLIRTNFNETEALEMLRNNPPNLEVPIAQVAPPKSTKRSLGNVAEPLKERCRLMKQQNNNERFTRQLSRPDDRWENVKHIVPAIQQLRQKSAGAIADDAIFSQMCRLLYSELLPIFGPELAVKIDMFTRTVCESPLDRIENLDIGTIKTYLTSNSQNDNFLENAGNLLSTPCPICLTSFPRNQLETMFLCDHKCCLGCLKDYYRNNINNIQDGRSLRILTCFSEQHEISTEIHLNFFTWLGSKLKQWFSTEPDILLKYHDKIFEATRVREIKRCGNPKCTASFFGDDNGNIASFRCPHCNFAQCGQCCRTWDNEHRDMNCDEYAEWLIDNDPDNPDVQALKFLGANAILCPACEDIFEYVPGGCAHFTCRNCQADFCRMCYELFYSPKKNPKCPHKTCTLKDLHAHCKPNCFREIRDGQTDAMIRLLDENDIDAAEELQKKHAIPNDKCPTAGCEKPTVADSEHRLCIVCYKFLLCSLIWNHQLEPWEIYEDNNLQQILTKASIPIPAGATRPYLIELCQQHLNQSLGKPKKIVRRKT